MACGCQGGAQADQWEPVYPDMTVGPATTKTQAQAQASQAGGYARPVQRSGAR